MLRWLYLDMNSFFAAVEQQDDPALRGRPVGVVPVISKGTCCIAASYEAKAFGVKTGTNAVEAQKLCPGIAIVRARPHYYVEVHHEIIKAIERHAPIDKVESIDEVGVRLIGPDRDRQRAMAIGQAMKDQIQRDVGECLTSSVGLAPTRLLAKTASDMQKPDGLTVLDHEDLPQRLLNMPINDIPGIGENMYRRLTRHGIDDMETLWCASKQRLREIWGGVMGEYFYNGLHGIDTPPPATHTSSMGHANVLDPQLRTDEGAHGILTRLLHKLGQRLRKKNYWAHRLHVSVNYDKPHRWANEINLPSCQDTLTLIEHFERLWAKRPSMNQLRSIGAPRKVGITVTGLTPHQSTTGLLFQHQHHRQNLAHALDRINQRYGPETLRFAGTHAAQAHLLEDKIAFGRVPEASSPSSSSPSPSPPSSSPPSSSPP